MNDWKKIQRTLKEKGFDPGPIDGIPGPRTQKAVIDFKRSVGLRTRAYVGPITRGVLFNNRKPRSESLKEAGEDPAWLRLARMEIGVRELPGYRHNKRILWYWVKSKLGFTDDETPWCAGFVGAMLEAAGIRSTRSGMARSYTRFGRNLAKPVRGAIVVFWRGKRNGPSGHVGFYMGDDQNGNVMCLGGNQGNEVNIKPFSRYRVLGYYWPDSVPVSPEAEAPVMKSDGQLSTSEA